LGRPVENALPDPRDRGFLARMNAPTPLRRAAAFLAPLLCLVFAPLTAAPATSWRAGTARENITPPAGLWMTGYASRDKPAEGTAQELWAKALAVADPAGNRGVVITLDQCGISRQSTDRVAAELVRRHGLPRSAVMVNVSHTHCSPQLAGNLNGIQILPPDGLATAVAYTRDLEQRMIRVADAADRALARPLTQVEGGVAAAWGDVTLKFSRRPTEEQLREAETKQQPNQGMHRAWAASVRELIRTRGDKLLEYDYPVQAWRLGGLSWVALGGEVVIDYALRLRREAGDNLWVFGYSNDVMAYIPSERVLKEGRYEGDTSMVPYGQPGPWSPGLEDRIISKTRELLTRTAPPR